MNRKSLPLLATLAAAACLATACGSSSNDSSAGAGSTTAPSASAPSSPAPPSATTAVVATRTKAATTRAVLTDQLVEHVYLAGIATGTALSQGPDSAAYTAAAKTLDNNSVALSKTVGSVYGDAGAAQFLDLWRKHIGFFVEYTLGAAKGDSAMKKTALAKLDG